MVRKRWSRIRFAVPVVLLTACLLSCGSRTPSTTLAIVHLNDTHSHLEPLAVNLTVDGVKTTAELGGCARIKTALDGMRKEYPRMLLLHGGDAVQGTLYFTLFGGALEYDLLGMLGVDAMTFGNHEFDRGIAPLAEWIGRSRFPWLSANIDFSGEPAIAPLVKTHVIREVDGERVAVIGVTTETTPQTTRNVGKASFLDAVTSVRRQVEALTAQGINKIVLLSHLGYGPDQSLAAQVSGIDVIVGGHSHSLLGDARRLQAIGLAPEGPYPTVLKAPDGKRVLVLQAWQWGHVLGNIRVRFSPEGEVTEFDAGIVIPLGDRFLQDGVVVPQDSDRHRRIRKALADSGEARIVPEDPSVQARLSPYSRQVAAYRSVAVASAAEDILRGLNSGPGPLAADSMLAAVPGARVALLNNGGIRRDLHAGTISVNDVLEVMPFGNTLVLVDLTGEELRAALEEGIDFLLRKYPLQNPPALPYLAGAVFSLRPGAPKGQRVSDLAVRDLQGSSHPVESGRVYRTVVNSFVAGGGDGFTPILKAGGFRSDTGVIDSDAFRDHLKALGSVVNPTEQRIGILP